MATSPQAQHSPGTEEARELSATCNGPRKRTRRACDKCSNFRVRCDGGHPCRRCQEYGHDCNYARDVKKRGRKPLSQRLGTNYSNRASLDPATPDFYTSVDHIDQYSPLQHPESYSRNRLTGHGTSYESSERAAANGLDHERQASFKDYGDRDYPNGITSEVDALEDGDEVRISAAVRPPRAVQPVRRISQIINPPLPTPSLAHPTDNVWSMGAPPSQARYSANFRGSDCRYRCLEDVVPLLDGIFDAKTACDLLEFYFAEPDSALFRHASPYVLSPVIRKQSLLHATNPRPTTSALLVTMLWTSAQTADIPLLLLPGWRGQICEKLRVLAMALVHERDRDHWHRALGTAQDPQF